MRVEGQDKILIVEDEDALSRALKTKLESEGFLVTIARDGEDGLRRFAEISPDLILLDIAMPRMDGVTMLKHLRSSNHAVPVIILTNLEDKCHEEDVPKELYTDCLVKADWKIEDIVKRIQEVLLNNIS